MVEIITETAIVTVNCLNNWPVIPERKLTGTKNGAEHKRHRHKGASYLPHRLFCSLVRGQMFG